ncbi:MAG TPA: FG-GAP-like repeat-containing protein [Puia sp.]|nr:FG-GAP-like repeat-containing protein [Puia sp.]
MLRKIASAACFDACLLIIFMLIIAISTGCKSKNADSDDKDPRFAAIGFLQENKFDEAEVAFKKSEKMHPENILNYINLSMLYLSGRNYSDAESQVNAGLKIQPANIDLKLILSELYIQGGNKEKAVKELGEVLGIDAKNLPAYYKLATLSSMEENYPAQRGYLLKILDIDPSNIVPRVQLAESLAGEGKSDSALFYMQSVKKIAPEFNVVTDTIYKKAVSLLAANQASRAMGYIARFHQLIQATNAYAAGLDKIQQPKLFPGYSEFNDSKFSQSYEGKRKVTLNDIRFVDASQSLGLIVPGSMDATRSTMAMADDDGKGVMYVYASFLPKGASASKRYLFARDMENFKDIAASAGLSEDGTTDLSAAFADYDNDGYRDLIVSTNKGIRIYKNNGDGTFSKVKQNAGLENVTNGNKLLIADFDQDGDLDIYVACSGSNKFFRNNGDGSFTENAAAMNLSANASGTIAMDFGDWDTDGDLDIAALSADGSVLLLNNDRHSKFENFTDSLQLNKPAYNGRAIAFGDYNNDGMSDLLVAGGRDGSVSLLRNTGHGFVPDPASQELSKSLKGVTVDDAIFMDFDNDGHQDILVAGTSEDKSVSGVQLFHNDTTKGFSDVSNLLPPTLTQGHHVDIADFNLDGDDDIFISGPTGVYLIRNDGGNLNHYMQVQLTGLSYANSKNNRFGIGSQIELKAGDLYQMKTIRRALTNFGVGMRDSLDAVRIIWPNGAPQLINDPSRRQKLIEEEKLKGSCPFLFAWDGKQYAFVKDMMWRSVLGMPLAINGRDTTYAFSDPSKEYLLIPGEKLQPKDNKYTIKITEELWEAVYFDKAALIAVDHPDSVNLYADERFTAPPFAGKKLYEVADKHLPVSAVDDQGNDQLQKIKAYDFDYVCNFAMGKFQGLTQDHDLILDLGDKAVSDSLYLFLRGWTFPGDASISTSMAQGNKYRQHPPSLQVMNKKGAWQTVIPNIGFPMGKDKMVIVNLSGKFLTANNRKVRIHTNMQVYWDEIFFSTGNAKAPVNMHDLTMTNATLAFRGYSASYRKGGPFGPHWFDYYQTSQGQKWRDLTGYYTRYGDVLPLLQEADDQYIIATAGDEMTIDFAADNLPVLPKGWKRDFLIYSEGWVKDGDLNTAYGQTVAPLPFHDMPRYPYRGNVAYPSDAKHKLYQQQYNTRLVNTDNFKNALKPKDAADHAAATK